MIQIIINDDKIIQVHKPYNVKFSINNILINEGTESKGTATYTTKHIVVV